MELTNIGTIKSILTKNNLWTKKNLGQNFLVSKNVLNRIVDSAKISDDDTVVEIGPGLGVLTEELSKNAKLVLAIEKDYDLVEFLRRRFKSHKNVKIIHGDVLTYDLELMAYGYKIVANLPYNITSPVIRKFLEAENKPSEMIIMVQKEVGERLVAKPSNSDRGILTVMIEFYGYAEIIDIVKRICFWPIPNVDSAIIKIILKQKNRGTEEPKNLGTIDPISFMRLVKIGFSQKRRQIHHPLSSGLHLSKVEISDILKATNIEPTLRAEDLRLEDWKKLYIAISKISN